MLYSAVTIQADTAPDSVAGYTFTAFDTGIPINKLIVVGTHRFTETNDGAFKRSGPYSYGKLSSTTGRAVFLRDDSSGDSDTVTFDFTTVTNGTYSNARLRQGFPDTRTGNFTASFTRPPQIGDASSSVRTNQFGFTIAEGTGRIIVVEASTSLLDSVWHPLGTNSLTSASAYFSDPQWTNSPIRFYRLRSP